MIENEEGDSMETDPLDKRLISRAWGQWRPAVIGCSVMSVFVLALLILLIVSFSKSPYYRNLAVCKSNIQQVGDALGRYAIKNDTYPEDLKSLAPDYIPESVLHCPADKSGSKIVSYVYEKADIDAPDNAILLTCEYHKLKSKFPGIILYYRKDGSVTAVPAPK